MTTQTNTKKMDKIEETLTAMLVHVLKKGFYGTARIEFDVQDGTIQHIRRNVEQAVS